jgi:hypothetical protein
MAARASLPSKLTKNVSTKLKVNNIIIPTIIGIVMLINACLIEP